MALLPNETIANFLNISIIKNKLIELDLWSIVHFFSGFVLFLLLKTWFPNTSVRFAVLLALLIFYEIFEILFNGTLFRTESMTNIVWDVLIAMIGAYVAMRWYE